jgi:isopentenyl diphosphate isomerase/L-lactate dehydrogenase-like FMN-dependent dehydrogenase
MTRRQVLASSSAMLLRGQASSKPAPLPELLNAYEFEAAAQRKLDAATYEEIASSNRAPFDRITFRPRLMVDTIKLNLTLDLFGQSMFAPIVVGPAAEQKRFHPDAELAMARGAGAAKAVVVISSRSSLPIEQIAAQAKSTLWYQVFPEPEMIARARAAVKCGCKAVCLTVGASKEPGVNWDTIDRLRDAVGVPLLLKGIMSAGEAQTAITHGVKAIVVSSYNGRSYNAAAPSITVLPAIVDAVAGKVPVLVDGGFCRGSDVLKALALGAKAVLLGRSPLWALTAYGAEGVQRLLELLQTELARDMAMCGRLNLKAIDRSVIKLHRA